MIYSNEREREILTLQFSRQDRIILCSKLDSQFK